MKIRELTTEHLGQVATEEDLAAFKTEDEAWAQQTGGTAQ